jgi:hypothetical protein
MSGSATRSRIRSAYSRKNASRSRVLARSAVGESQFREGNPRAVGIIEAAGEIVAELALFLSEKDLRTLPEGLQRGDLIVSYCRSQFIVADLIVQGELIDAVVLLPKQLELVARLWELMERDPRELLRRTPNVVACEDAHEPDVR